MPASLQLPRGTVHPQLKYVTVTHQIRGASHNPMNQSITDGGWEKEFDEKFYDGGEPKHIVAEHPSMNMRYPATVAQIKSFLRTQISEAVEKERELRFDAMNVSRAAGIESERQRILAAFSDNEDADIYRVGEIRSLLKDTSHTVICGAILFNEEGYGKFKLPPQPDRIIARCENLPPCPIHGHTTK